jgi:hypothetical protein
MFWKKWYQSQNTVNMIDTTELYIWNWLKLRILCYVFYYYQKGLLSIVLHICNPSNQDAKAGEAGVRGQPGLYLVSGPFFSLYFLSTMRRVPSANVPASIIFCFTMDPESTACQRLWNETSETMSQNE